MVFLFFQVRDYPTIQKNSKPSLYKMSTVVKGFEVGYVGHRISRRL